MKPTWATSRQKKYVDGRLLQEHLDEALRRMGSRDRVVVVDHKPRVARPSHEVFRQHACEHIHFFVRPTGHWQSLE